MKQSPKLKLVGWIYLILAMIFVLGPILVTIAFSFNLDRFSSLPWRGFTLQWYEKMFSNEDIIHSLGKQRHAGGLRLADRRTARLYRSLWTAALEIKMEGRLYARFHLSPCSAVDTDGPRPADLF